jgi:hypothetical protein
VTYNPNETVTAVVTFEDNEQVCESSSDNTTALDQEVSFVAQTYAYNTHSVN